MRALFTGGTFCYEASLLLGEALGQVWSNAPVRHEDELDDEDMDEDDYDDLDDEFEAMFERGWTDGLPVVPPTEERVRAFLAGMLLAESPFASQIRADVGSLRTIFVTLFFTAVGMLAEPAWFAARCFQRTFLDLAWMFT